MGQVLRAIFFTRLLCAASLAAILGLNLPAR